jgi:large subunit ribosomal protein L25
MSNETVIHSTMRSKKGKSAVRKLHNEGFIPAVVYGHNITPVVLSLNASEINKMFKAGSHDSEDYRLIKLTIKENDDSQEKMVIVKEMQRHPVNSNILHIDFFAVRMDEKITAPVHIRVIGQAEGVKLGGIMRQIVREIEVKSLPSDIPPHFDIDVSNLNIGDSLHVSDIEVSDNIQVLLDPDAPIVSILAPTIHAEETTTEEEGAGEGEGEGEEAKAEEPSADADTK